MDPFLESNDLILDYIMCVKFKFDLNGVFFSTKRLEWCIKLLISKLGLKSKLLAPPPPGRYMHGVIG